MPHIDWRGRTQAYLQTAACHEKIAGARSSRNAGY